MKLELCLHFDSSSCRTLPLPLGGRPAVTGMQGGLFSSFLSELEEPVLPPEPQSFLGIKLLTLLTPSEHMQASVPARPA